MTLESFYFLAQIIAGMAVVASLVFVGLQVRGSTREQRLTRTYESVAAYEVFQHLLINNREFREIWLKGAKGLDNLDDQELLAFGAYMALWISSAMRDRASMGAGHRDNRDWQVTKSMWKPITRRKGAQQWWQRARRGYAPDVRVVIDEVFAEIADTQESKINDA